MATATDKSDIDTEPTSGLHIKDDWKAQGMYAIFDGDRLVTRSATREVLEDALARMQRNHAAPFSTRVAPVEITEDDSDDAPRKNKRASWAE